MQTLDRKADTRSKIQMGGLVKKAGLDDLHKSNPIALLGALLEIKSRLNDKNEGAKYLQEYEKIGKLNFDNQ